MFCTNAPSAMCHFCWATWSVERGAHHRTDNPARSSVTMRTLIQSIYFDYGPIQRAACRCPHTQYDFIFIFGFLFLFWFWYIYPCGVWYTHTYIHRTPGLSVFSWFCLYVYRYVYLPYAICYYHICTYIYTYIYQHYTYSCVTWLHLYGYDTA